MAVRSNVLRLNADNHLQGMGTAEISAIQEQAIYQYSLNPSVTLSVVASNGNLNSMTDRRYSAGTASSTNSSFPGDSQDVQPIDTVWDVVSMSVASNPPNVWDESNVNRAYPVYLNASNEICAMSREDFYDTIIDPAIAQWYAPVGSGNFAGAAQYAFYEGNGGLTGFSLVSSSPVFQNTVASTDLTTGNLPENPLDQPSSTTNDYYLYLKNASAVTYSLPFKINASGELEQFTAADFNSLLQYHMRYAIVSRVGSQIRYQIENTSGTQGRTSGAGIADTHYASFTRRNQQIGDVYYTQEVPSGSSTTRNTYYLKIVNAGSVDGSDTSETYTATVSPSGSVNEGNSVTFTLNTNNVANGTTVPYAITGITAADISSGSLSGNVTINSNSGSVSITIATDSLNENETATCSFTTTAGTKSASIDINDVTVEAVSLEGTSSNPKRNQFPPTPGTDQAWVFNTNGSIQWYNGADGVTQTAGFNPWCNVVNPTGDWYVRCTSRTGDGTIQSWSLNTWYKISGSGSNTRSFRISDLRTPGTYGPADSQFTFQISPNQSTIAATGYYELHWEGGA